MRKLCLALVPLFLALAPACVGDDPGQTAGTPDGGSDGATGPDGATPNGTPDGGDDDASAADAGQDGGAEVLCGYPGEECCEAPSLPCREGTTCATATNKCMVNELGAVGGYFVPSGPSAGVHLSIALFQGNTWSLGPDVLVQGFSGFSATDLISTGATTYYLTLFDSPHGKMYKFSKDRWYTCYAGGGQCVAPNMSGSGPGLDESAPSFWSVAKIADETWIAASDAIYRCPPGKPCEHVEAGLEATTWGTGKLVGTSTTDVWLSALTRAFHFDGATWTIHDGLEAHVVFQVRKDDVWVGDDTLQHYDGATWSAPMVIDGAPAPGIITSMSGSSSTDVWAVGYDPSTGAHPCFAAHWDGTKWSMTSLPAGTKESPSVYAPSPLEAFLATQSGLYRWDGKVWTKITLPAPIPADMSWDYITGPAKPRP